MAKATRWGKGSLVASVSYCDGTLAGALDAAGRPQLATVCYATASGGPTHILYVGQRADGTWSKYSFPLPANRLQLAPQVAVDGNVLYVGYSSDRQDQGSCGDNGLRDVGVYYRLRTLPSGAWSAPKMIGAAKDHLVSFRVVDGVVHALVTAGDGRTFYEYAKSGTQHRYLIADSSGGGSLRIGDDGKARIVYAAANGIRFGVFNGSSFDTVRIPGSTRGVEPTLVLGAGNQPFLMWARQDLGGGCVEPDPQPGHGTWFTTLEAGVWTSRLVSTNVGHDMTLDPTGQLHAFIAERYYTRTPAGRWIASSFRLHGELLMKYDTAHRRLVVLYARNVHGAFRSNLYVITKS